MDLSRVCGYLSPLQQEEADGPLRRPLAHRTQEEKSHSVRRTRSKMHGHTRLFQSVYGAAQGGKPCFFFTNLNYFLPKVETRTQTVEQQVM